MTKKKIVEHESEKIDFSDSVEAVKSTAKSVNTHIKEITEEVKQDMKYNTEYLKEMTVTPVIEAYDKIVETVTLDNLSKFTKDVNELTLKTTEELLEVTLENGEKWQKITKKAISGGLKLSAKQQDIVFDTLETVKGQLIDSTKRFKSLFSKN